MDVKESLILFHQCNVKPKSGSANCLFLIEETNNAIRSTSICPPPVLWDGNHFRTRLPQKLISFWNTHCDIEAEGGHWSVSTAVIIIGSEVEVHTAEWEDDRKLKTS